ncbi:FAS1 domain-containing [Hortaea werneckii]|nr:FAS1 domain-containing [Hortaea werneckii]
MKSYTLAASLLSSSLLIATSQAQLIPFFHKPSAQATPPSNQQPMANAPGIQLPPEQSSNNPSSSPPPAPPAAPLNNDVILSDVIGTQKAINIFAGFTRDISSVSTRLDTTGLNTTVLAPVNSALSSLPRKPWEDPADYQRLGAAAYEGEAGSDRASQNLKRFTEAHVIPVSPWKQGEKVRNLGGKEMWWEVNREGKAVVQPGEVEVERVVSRVANGEVWMLNGVVDYAS